MFSIYISMKVTKRKLILTHLSYFIYLFVRRIYYNSHAFCCCVWFDIHILLGHLICGFFMFVLFSFFIDCEMSVSPFAEISFYSPAYTCNFYPYTPRFLFLQSTRCFFQSERTGRCVGIAEWTQACFLNLKRSGAQRCWWC